MSPPSTELPTVGVVIPNFNGRVHLEPLFESLDALEYPREALKIIVVDNGSTDGSKKYLRQRHPQVRLVAYEMNHGFATACNAGVQEAPDCEIVVFLNNDMRVEPNWLKALIDPITEGRAQATSSRLMSWDGQVVDFAGGGMNFHGIGIQQGYLEEVGPEHLREKPCLFPCGGSGAVVRSTFQDSGGFDEDYFAYYEDVDLGWRLWILGHKVLYVPTSVAYHHHAATARTFGYEHVRVLQMRNPLYTILKCYEASHLAKVFPVALLLSLRRTMYMAGLDEAPFRIERAGARRTGGMRDLLFRMRQEMDDRIPVNKLALADLVAYQDVIDNMSRTLAKREEIQKQRKRPDTEIFPLFHDPMWVVEPPDEYRRLQNLLSDFFGVDTLFSGSGGNGHK